LLQELGRVVEGVPVGVSSDESWSRVYLESLWAQETISSTVFASSMSMGQTLHGSVELGEPSITGIQAKVKLTSLLLLLLRWPLLLEVVVVVIV